MRINNISFNKGIEAAALLHESAANQYERLHLSQDVEVHQQWAYNIRALKQPEPNVTSR